MMLKNYLKKNKITVYSLAKKAGVPYSTLSDLVNGKVEIENCRLRFLKSLAGVLDITLDELCAISEEEIKVYVERFDINAEVGVKNKMYYAYFNYKGADVELPICRINEDIKMFRNDVITWHIEDYIADQRMKELEKSTFT